LQIILESKNLNYSRKIIKKKKGFRNLDCIQRNSALYILQKRIVKNILNDIPLPDVVFGFIEKKSYKDFLLPHKHNIDENRNYLRLDIKNYFESITNELLKKELNFIVKTKNSEINASILEDIIEIITLNGSLPQGAVTSPIVSNIFFRRIDQRIYKYCKKRNVIYTRYADDLLFSTSNARTFSQTNVSFFIKMIVKILKDFNLSVNRSKIMQANNLLSLNGFVIEEEVRLSRKRIHDINKVLFLFECSGKPNTIQDYLNRLNASKFNCRTKKFYNKMNVINYLAGHRAFLIDWSDKELGTKTQIKSDKLIRRIEDLLIELMNL